MNNETYYWIVGIVALVILIGILSLIMKGAIQTFKRNWLVAVLLIIFVFPIWFIGAVANVVGIQVGVVSGLLNPHDSSVLALKRRPRHEERYHISC